MCSARPAKEGRGPYSKEAERPSPHTYWKRAYIILDPKEAVVRQVQNKDGKGSILSAQDLIVWERILNSQILVPWDTNTPNMTIGILENAPHHTKCNRYIIDYLAKKKKEIKRFRKISMLE